MTKSVSEKRPPSEEDSGHSGGSWRPPWRWFPRKPKAPSTILQRRLLGSSVQPSPFVGVWPTSGNRCDRYRRSSTTSDTSHNSLTLVTKPKADKTNFKPFWPYLAFFFCTITAFFLKKIIITNAQGQRSRVIATGTNVWLLEVVRWLEVKFLPKKTWLQEKCNNMHEYYRLTMFSKKWRNFLKTENCHLTSNKLQCPVLLFPAREGQEARRKKLFIRINLLILVHF